LAGNQIDLGIGLLSGGELDLRELVDIAVGGGDRNGIMCRRYV